MSNLLRRIGVLLLAAAPVAVPDLIAADVAGSPVQLTPVQQTQAQQTLVQRLLDHDRALFVLDVRTAEEFAAGHLGGARNIAHDQLETLSSALPADKNTEIVVYCRSGRRSALAVASLQKLGFTRVLHLAGDYIGWEAAHRPVVATGPPLVN